MKRYFLFLFSALVAGPLFAASGIYPLPAPNEALVGELAETVTREEDTLVALARKYRTGYEALRAANPEVDAWLPGEGTPVVLPTRHLLPEAPREGIVVNIAELRLYHYENNPERPDHVGVYSVSIGRDGRETPQATTRVTRKAKDPTWYPPESIRRDHAARGHSLSKVVPPGPANPLGRHAIYLGLPAYLIHGTNNPLGLGMQVTNGCVRMYPEDIESIFGRVPVGSQVSIVNQPVKAGWSDGVLYVESHKPLEGGETDWEARVAQLREALMGAVSGRENVSISWEQAEEALRKSSGLPVPVGSVWSMAGEGESAVQHAAQKTAGH
ncbi:L,D-transpeptidase family protein [Haliea atlantica]